MRIVLNVRNMLLVIVSMGELVSCSDAADKLSSHERTAIRKANKKQAKQRRIGKSVCRPDLKEDTNPPNYDSTVENMAQLELKDRLQEHSDQLTHMVANTVDYLEIGAGVSSIRMGTEGNKITKANREDSPKKKRNKRAIRKEHINDMNTNIGLKNIFESKLALTKDSYEEAIGVIRSMIGNITEILEESLKAFFESVQHSENSVFFVLAMKFGIISKLCDDTRLIKNAKSYFNKECDILKDVYKKGKISFYWWRPGAKDAIVYFLISLIDNVFKAKATNSKVVVTGYCRKDIEKQRLSQVELMAKKYDYKIFEETDLDLAKIFQFEGEEYTSANLIEPVLKYFKMVEYIGDVGSKIYNGIVHDMMAVYNKMAEGDEEHASYILAYEWVEKNSSKDILAILDGKEKSNSSYFINMHKERIKELKRVITRMIVSWSILKREE
ncbi:hypothetical protein PAEPH01_0672 [Pancytospora epiphaga]|nr:hypothetical protein PAEPH01_0672 [Pancytospora epiphaga]